MKKLACLLLCLIGCSTTPVADKSFQKQSQAFLDDLWRTYPDFAVAVGRHEFDAGLVVPDEQRRVAEENFVNRHLSAFKSIEGTQLSPSARADRDLIVNYLESELWSLKEFQSHVWNPSRYNVGSSLSSVLEGAEKTENLKLVAILQKLENVPAYYQAAKKSIHRPTREHTQLAIKQNKALMGFLNGDLKARAEKSSLKNEEKDLLLARLLKAEESVKNYVTWLESLLKNPDAAGGFRDFRISPQHYARKFTLDLESSFSADEIYQQAVNEKAEILQKMAPLADGLWSKYLPGKKKPKNATALIKQVIEKISEQHTQPANFVETIRLQLPHLSDFVIAKNLLTLDPQKPLKVRETPVFQRGVAGASVDSPGPFESKRETFYNVTPLDDMDAKAQESYLREYNDFTLQILNIHEAIPGHYVQLVYANRSPSLIKSIFGNGTMIEGWAVYAERMMLEAGYGDNSPELWLMYYKWFLRVITNTILDYEIHNRSLSKDKALHYLVNEAFQEKAEAEQKWVRATVSQVQLASYYTGFSEIYRFREEQKSKLGQSFKLKEFHENFLSYGSASIRTIRSLMLESMPKSSAR